MTPAIVAALGVSAAASLAYGLWLTHQAPGVLRSAVKTAPVALLAGVSAMAGGPVLLTLALAFGALGDLALSRPGRAAFLAGLASFGAAHLALVALLWPAGDWRVTGAPLAPVLLAVGMAVVVLPHAGRLRGPVALYMVLIAAMGWAALQPGTGRIVQCAAVLFMISDSLLSIGLFRLEEEHRAQRPLAPAVWFTYWSAQVLFLLAFVPPGSR